MGGDLLFNNPDMAKPLVLLLLLDSAAAIPPPISSEEDGNGLTDAGSAPTVGGLLLPPLTILLPGGLVIMDVTDAGMDSPVVWFM